MTRAPTQTRAKRTRQQLLEAARRVFAGRGYASATVDDVAEAAGYSKGAYYFHFDSKEDALLALLDEWARERSRSLADASDGGRDVRAALRATLAALLVPDGEKRLLLEFWTQAQERPRVRRRLADAERSWRRPLVRALHDAQAAGILDSHGDTEALASAALAISYGLALQACLAGTSNAGRRADAAMALLLPPRALRRAG
jgi:AcrR family transcriptional regulator